MVACAVFNTVALHLAYPVSLVHLSCPVVLVLHLWGLVPWLIGSRELGFCLVDRGIICIVLGVPGIFYCPRIFGFQLSCSWADDCRCIASEKNYFLYVYPYTLVISNGVQATQVPAGAVSKLLSYENSVYWVASTVMGGRGLLSVCCDDRFSHSKFMEKFSDFRSPYILVCIKSHYDFVTLCHPFL